MPRAFLITNKRYNSAVDYEENHQSRESSPERRVSTAEGSLVFRTPCDSETDSIGFESLKPTSPHSPAHESRSRQQSPSEDKSAMGISVYSQMDNSTTPPPTFNNLQLTSTSPCNVFRPCQTTTSALVTVIRQLMQHQPTSTIIGRSRIVVHLLRTEAHLLSSNRFTHMHRVWQTLQHVQQPCATSPNASQRHR
ncbi:transcriptional repressor scratch 1 [Caerostris extrusa]|uniref:Transcriptional repressor scratch 1 n=1 Tax=Caerostris extrusa TaxID=172846 RepID=A0AAV4N273_CAEEX|nr:transcriptional repressor scratch 1 [Caerostris extrusa]